MDPKSINDVVKKVIDSLPDGVKQLPEDLKKNIHEAIRSTLDKMDVVTREEFDTQRKVLERTRAKLEALEKEVAELSDKSKK